MIKKVPNILSVLRIVFAASLIFCVIDFEKGRIFFLILFLLGGITDFLDGYIARRYDACSDLGTKLDLLGDASFVIISFACFIYLIFSKAITFKTTRYIIFTLVFAASLKLSVYITTFIKFKVLNGLHTYLNKLVGTCYFFAIPVCIYLRNVPEALQYGVIILWIISACDELVVLIKSDKFEPNVKGVLGKIFKGQ